MPSAVVTRRGRITLIAAPAVIRVANLMPVRGYAMSVEDLACLVRPMLLRAMRMAAQEHLDRMRFIELALAYRSPELRRLWP